jgi:hypothetical protein
MSRFVLIFPLGVAVGLTGCGACRTSNFVSERPYSCNRCLDNVQPPRHAAAPGLPPGRQNFAAVPAPSPAKPLPDAPPGPAVEGGSATFVPPSGDSPPPPPSDALSRIDEPLPRSSAPSADMGSPDVRLGPPAPIRREAASTPPDATKEPPVANVPGADKRPKSTDPDNKEMPQAIDLPGFAIAAPGVANGIKPFPDGIAWLAEKGYKTVLHLRGPAEDTAATRRMFEGKGLKYVSLEGSPARLSKDVYEAFVKQVKDADSHPLFVYDKDGSVAGGLWYLYYRVEKNETDEKARAEAQRLGLRFDDDPEHQAMVLAAQRLLSELKP